MSAGGGVSIVSRNTAGGFSRPTRRETDLADGGTGDETGAICDRRIKAVRVPAARMKITTGRVPADDP